MDEAHKELVKRLRALRIMDEVGSDNPLGREAADALEALAGEVERWRNNSDNGDVQIADLIAERDRLKAQNIAWADKYGDTQNAMYAALDERDRLKAALQDCVDAYDFVIVNEYDRGWSSVSDAIHAARKALGDAS